MSKAKYTTKAVLEMERTAAQRAKDRANVARWNLDIAIFLFAVLITIIILTVQRISFEIMASFAILALTMVWLAGWRRGRRLFQRFYDEELVKLKRELKEKDKDVLLEALLEDKIETEVQNGLRERLRQGSAGNQ